MAQVESNLSSADPQTAGHRKHWVPSTLFAGRQKAKETLLSKFRTKVGEGPPAAELHKVTRMIMAVHREQLAGMRVCCLRKHLPEHRESMSAGVETQSESWLE